MGRKKAEAKAMVSPVVSRGWQREQPKLKTVTCSLVTKTVVYIEPTARQKIELLMEAYTHQEWLAYLVGKYSDSEVFFIEDISVPPHELACGSSAVAEPFHHPENCLGVIHSHHSMGAFHSGTDREYVDISYPLSITVAKKGGSYEFDAVSNIKTPCGQLSSSKPDVKFVRPAPTFDTQKWLTEAKKNIEKGRVTPQTAASCGHGVMGYLPAKYRVAIAEQGVTDPTDIQEWDNWGFPMSQNPAIRACQEPAERKGGWTKK